LKNQPQHKVVLIIGMARSGTSMMGGVFSKLGVYLGESLAEPSPMNKKGFFEDQEIVNLNDQFLLNLGVGWPKPLPLPIGWASSQSATAYEEKILKIIVEKFSNKPVFAIKDPTISRLLPIWVPLLSKLNIEPIFIQMVRNHYEVYASMTYGEGGGKRIKPEQACLLWLRHNIEGERYTRWKKRVFVKYDAVLTNPPEMIKKIAEFCEIPIPDLSNDEPLNFIDISMKHYNFTSIPVTFTSPFSNWSDRIYKSFPDFGNLLDTSVLEEVNNEIEKMDQFNFLSGIYEFPK
jgi:hypothetical protein